MSVPLNTGADLGRWYEVWLGGRCILHDVAENGAEALRRARRRHGGVITQYVVLPSHRDPQWRCEDDETLEVYCADFLGLGLVITRRPESRTWIWSVQRLRAAHELRCEIAGGSCATLATAQQYAARAAREVLP